MVKQLVSGGPGAKLMLPGGARNEQCVPGGVGCKQWVSGGAGGKQCCIWRCMRPIWRGRFQAVGTFRCRRKAERFRW